jgi:hypothetical protein
VFTVTLNPPTQSVVKVTFETADGTAHAGIDYLAASKVVTFAPGQTEQTVEVQLLTEPGTGLRFFGQLSSPENAAVWISRGSTSF